MPTPPAPAQPEEGKTEFLHTVCLSLPLPFKCTRTHTHTSGQMVKHRDFWLKEETSRASGRHGFGSELGPLGGRGEDGITPHRLPDPDPQADQSVPYPTGTMHPGT